MDILLILAAALVSAAAVAFYFMTRQRIAGEQLVRVTETARALEAQLAAAQRQLAERDDRLSAANERLLSANDIAAQERAGLTAEIASLKTREAEYRKQLEEKAVEIAALHEKLKVEFENIAGRILKDSREQLATSSKEKLDAVLAPFSEKIAAFKQKVEQVYDTERGERISLKTQLEQMVQANASLGTQAENLTKALKGDSQKRGNWGEVVLENILKASGLVEGRDYIAQGRDLGLKSENGGLLRPDIIINLPEGHHIIVDSKVTLVAYDAYVAANDEAEHEAARVAFVAAVKGHVNDLAGKAYQDNPKLKAPDFVFMFLPIEGALALALESDPQLFTYAWERRVAIVGPSMLMTSLRLVAGVWSIERREENAQRIAEEAAGLYEQVRLVLESVESLGTRIDQSQKAYDQVISRLTQGRGNLIRRVENFPKLGVVVKKQIPELAAAARPLENVIE